MKTLYIYKVYRKNLASMHVAVDKKSMAAVEEKVSGEIQIIEFEMEAKY